MPETTEPSGRVALSELQRIDVARLAEEAVYAEERHQTPTPGRRGVDERRAPEMTPMEEALRIITAEHSIISESLGVVAASAPTQEKWLLRVFAAVAFFGILATLLALALKPPTPAPASRLLHLQIGSHSKLENLPGTAASDAKTAAPRIEPR